MLVHDLDVYGELHLPLGDVDGPLTRLDRDRDVGIVAHHAAVHERVGVLLRCHAESEPALEGLANRLADFLRQRGFGGVVVEGQDRDGLDVWKGPTVKPIDAAADPQARSASDDYATEPAG